MIHLSHPITCIVGPTSSGKTALAEAYAKHVAGEIISADSMQIYRGMDIGTGKIPASDRSVPYHGLDVVDPDEPYSAALFQAYARNAISEIDSRSKPIIVAGGTGFYIRAAIDDYAFPQGEQLHNPVRDRFERFYERKGADALWQLLYERDPESASCIHRNNVKRVIRALEISEEGGSYAALSKKLPCIPQRYEAVFIGLDVEREALYKRIDDRVDIMVEEGLIPEVQGLLNKGFRDGITSLQAIGYKEIVSFLDGEIDLASALDQIKRATRRYAKRQLTWFKKDKRIAWIDATYASADELLHEALRIARGHEAI